jgi:hypothetical protein
MAAKKKMTKKVYETKIERICSKAIVDMQINIMELSKIHNAAVKAFAESEESGAYETTPGLQEEVVIAKVREFARTLDQKPKPTEVLNQLHAMFRR